MIAEPLSVDDFVQKTVAEPVPAVALTPVGATGVPITIAPVGGDRMLVPLAFLAAILEGVYASVAETVDGLRRCRRVEELWRLCDATEIRGHDVARDR